MRIYLLIAAIAGGVTWLVTPLIRHVAIEIGAVGEVRARCQGVSGQLVTHSSLYI